MIGEFGWQVDIGPALAARYSGKENVPITEAQQADHYSELVGMLGCDPMVTDALLLHMVDDPDAAVSRRACCASTSASGRLRSRTEGDRVSHSCKTLTSWTHATGVVGAKAIFDARDHPAHEAVFGISTRAAEEARAKAGMFRVSGPGAKPATTRLRAHCPGQPGTRTPWRTTRKLVRRVTSRGSSSRGQVAPGHCVFGLASGDDEPRSSRTFVSKVFRVG